jgi:hypothetical protein
MKSEGTQRCKARQAVWCRRSGWSVSGRRSTAAETHENDAAVHQDALNASFLAFTFFEASSTDALCSSGVDFVSGFPKRVCPWRAGEERARKQTIPTLTVDKIAMLFAKGGSGFSVQPCRRGTARLLSFPGGRRDVQTPQIVLPRSIHDNGYNVL